MVSTLFDNLPPQRCRMRPICCASSIICVRQPGVCEADRHAKKELKKLVRGLRPPERAAENDSAPNDVVLGYCAAVRSALTEDARPPLVFAGQRLRQHLVDIHDSVQKSTKKRGH
jgi:hypothetical protein